MDSLGFEKFLIAHDRIESKNKAVVSRLTKAAWIENNLKIDLDMIISNPRAVLSLRADIYRKAPTPRYAGNIYNALRWYFYNTYQKTPVF